MYLLHREEEEQENHGTRTPGVTAQVPTYPQSWVSRFSYFHSSISFIHDTPDVPLRHFRRWCIRYLCRLQPRLQAPYLRRVHGIRKCQGVYVSHRCTGFSDCWLALNRGDLKKPTKNSMAHLKPLSDLWISYNSHLANSTRFLEYGRRIAITRIAVLVRPDSVAHIAVVLLLAVVFLFIVFPSQSSLSRSARAWTCTAEVTVSSYQACT